MNKYEKLLRLFLGNLTEEQLSKIKLTEQEVYDILDSVEND